MGCLKEKVCPNKGSITGWLQWGRAFDHSSIQAIEENYEGPKHLKTLKKRHLEYSEKLYSDKVI